MKKYQYIYQMIKSFITKYFYKIRQECWKIIDTNYAEGKDKYRIVRDLAENSQKNGCVILDAGCGNNSIILNQNDLKRKKLGIDIALNDIKKNKSIDYAICCNITCIALKNESVDLIICNMVIEHLQDPTVAFAEFSRVLKKGGYLIFMTPCIYNIVVFLSKMIPNRFHNKLVSLLTGINESNIFPTFYKANSIGMLRKMLTERKLVERDLIMYQPPPYAFVFSKIICKLIIHYFRIINKYDWMEALRGVIIARYQKI